MQTSRASTRGLALAAFLSVAAALFVVGPADASRTTDARSSLASIPAATLAPSSSRELASLELSLLEPLDLIDSASVSSRFGFAEDLRLLDVEASPCGIDLLGGVGTSRCVLTYARNNPLKYVDPDGRMWAPAQALSQAMKPVVEASQTLAAIAGPFDTNGILHGAAAMLDLTARTLNLGTGTGDAVGSGGGAFEVSIAAAGDLRTFSEATLVISGLGATAQAAMAPSVFGPGSVGAAEVRTLQSSGRTVSEGTAKALNTEGGMNLPRREWGRALERLKKANDVPNNQHGPIKSTGDVYDKAGNFVANVFEYLR